MYLCLVWLLAATLLSPTLVFAQAPASTAPGAVPAPQLPDLQLPPGATRPHPAGPPHTCPYPPVYMGPHDSGTTILRVRVGTAGTVENSVVAQSSGSPQLDWASQLCVKAWLYNPGMRDGRPIEAWVQTTINWVLPHRGEAAPTSPADTVAPPVRKFSANKCEWWHYHKTSGVLLAIYVEQDGTVKNPSVLTSSGDPAVDRDALDCVVQRSYDPAKQNGKPVEVRLTERMF